MGGRWQLPAGFTSRRLGPEYALMATIWSNGEWRRADCPVMAPGDRGALHGLGLFETLLAVEGAPVHLDRHWQRLEQGVERLGWTVPELDVAAVMTELLQRNQLEAGRARIRLALSGGSGSLRDLTPGADRLLTLSASRLGEIPQGLKVALCPWRRNEHSPLNDLKCSSYAENLVALDWARQDGLDEVLFLNTAGELCEAATANVFLVRNGALLTPALQSGCLPGVARSVILELADAHGIEAREATLGVEDLEQADECFLTSATHGVMAVSRLGEREYPNTPVSHQLCRCWEDSIRPDGRSRP